MERGQRKLDMWHFGLRGALRTVKSDSEYFAWRAVGAIALAAVILFITGFFVSPSVDWAILTWLVLSMSFFWVQDRLLHSIKGAAGETERDGIVWLLPLALGIIPATIFLIANSIETRVTAIIAWGILPTLLVQLVRPELPQSSVPMFLEQQGLFGGLKSLFKYRLAVHNSPTNDMTKRKRPRRLSLSAMIFYIGFIATSATLIVLQHFLNVINSNTREDLGALYGLLGGYLGAAVGFGAAFVRLMEATMNVSESRAGWPIQDEERQVLAALFFTSTMNILGASAVGFGIPLVLLIADKLSAP